MALNSYQVLVRKVSDHYDSDVLLYIGPIDRPYDDNFIRYVKNKKRRTNVLLILTTPGGDPHAAYRMARCLQEEYHTIEESVSPGTPGHSRGKFRLFVDTRCKSAGTIIATGANSIMFSDYGELGPIDVQLRKGDEVGERSSGLTPTHALESLQLLSSKHFEDTFRTLRFKAELAFGTKVATEIAANMVIGLFSPIFGQIDPMRIGEFDRAMRIAGDYGSRLGKSNLKEDALKRLLTGYPSHGFVIDEREAKELFNTVEEPIPDLISVAEVTRNWWNDQYLNEESPFILYLTTDVILDENIEVPNEQSPENAPADGAGTA